MPEGDAVYRTARRLDTLAGQTLTSADLRWPGVSELTFAGRTVVGTTTVGKHLLTHLEGDVTIHSHLRMDGRWVVAPLPGAPARHHAVRAVLSTDSHRATGWRLGMLEVCPSGQDAVRLAHVGPDALVEGWDGGVALERYRELPSTTSMGLALLDQGPMSGLGTIWTSEVLFVEKLSPHRPLAEVSDDALLQTIATSRRLLTGTLAFHTSVATGDPRHPTRVYERERQPCYRCREAVALTHVGVDYRRRRLFWCRRCQT